MTVGIAGRKETLTACVSEAAIPELLRKSALEPQGGIIGFRKLCVDCSESRAGSSLESQRDGALCPQRRLLRRRAPEIGSGAKVDGFVLRAGLCVYTPRVSASNTVTLRDARNECPSGPKKIIMKLPVNRGHASAQQLKGV